MPRYAYAIEYDLTYCSRKINAVSYIFGPKGERPWKYAEKGIYASDDTLKKGIGLLEEWRN